MKASNFFPRILIILFCILLFLPHERILAQDRNPNLANQGDNEPFRLSHRALTMPHFTTVRPTLGHYGKGLAYYESIILKYQGKTDASKSREEETPIRKEAKYSELELELLNRNLLFINKQSQIQIKEWIRKEKWDLNLGEAIKGFYMKPIF